MQLSASAEQTHKNEYHINMKHQIRCGLVISAMLSLSVLLSAQTSQFEKRYNLLVSQFGPAGVGVETVLDNWAKVDSTDYKLLLARFEFYFTKAKSSTVVTRPEKKYLGMSPVFTLKDSTGNDVNYYQVDIFDDELYGKAVKVVDKAISLYPDKIDLRFLKANAYIAYEKESPDMALAYLQDLAQKDAQRKKPWNYGDSETEKGFFEDAMLEYCVSFYTIGSSQSYEAFRVLSEKMLELHPGSLEYTNNIGTYYMVAKEDYKTALKYYDKVLKKDSDNYTALKNGMLAARKLKNTKLEEKYRKRLMSVKTE